MSLRRRDINRLLTAGGPCTLFGSPRTGHAQSAVTRAFSDSVLDLGTGSSADSQSVLRWAFFGLATQAGLDRGAAALQYAQIVNCNLYAAASRSDLNSDMAIRNAEALLD